MRHEYRHRNIPVVCSRLLSAIYRPWNSYCIQLDSKSSEKFLRVVRKLVQCYNSHYAAEEGGAGMFLSSSSLSLVWQHSSLLEGDLACLSQLRDRSHNWKFYVNVVGSEYPVMTNYQLLERLEQVQLNNQIFLFYSQHYR